MTDGFGSITWWGFSPALDLQDQSSETAALGNLNGKNDKGTEEEVCMLLVGSGDSRHLLKTIAQAHRHAGRRLHLYVLENSLELYGRHMLFLSLALECPARMGLQEKTELYLELFGNILVRQQSCEYIQRMANTFIKMVTDLDWLAKKLPVLDLSCLKFKERDFLEGIFKFWRNSDIKVFESWKLWDVRVRQCLKTRYDSRLNAYDWDYHMNLLEIGGHVDIIHKTEYSTWRDKGVAFQVREGTYEVPNKTLASGLMIKQNGESQALRGYWGDILVSPYIAVGIETDETSMYKKYNEAYGKTAQDVAEYNVLAMFHELTTGERYCLPSSEQTAEPEITGPTISEIIEEEEEEITASDKNSSETKELTSDPQTNPLDQEYEPLPVTGVQVTLLPLNSLWDMPKKNKFKKKFDLIYFSNSMVHQLTPEVSHLFKDRAFLTIETAKFMLELKAEQRREFSERVSGMAREAGCKPSKPCDGAKDSFAEFTYLRTTQL